MKFIFDNLSVFKFDDFGFIIIRFENNCCYLSKSWISIQEWFMIWLFDLRFDNDDSYEKFMSLKIPWESYFHTIYI